MANGLRSKLIDKHIAVLKALEGKKVEAGWFESNLYGKGTPVAYVARIQEWGATIQKGKATIIIPARPFMRYAWSTFDSERGNIQYKVSKGIIDGKLSVDKALGQIGMILEGHIVNSIKNGGWQGNAPSTIAKKGFDKPLIDTGIMWKSVNSKVS